MKTLGIIAGSGRFPFLVAEGAAQQGYRVVVCGIEHNADAALESACDAFIMLNVGKFGALIDFFKKNKVQDVCMAGAVDKPKAMNFTPDLRAAGLLLKLMQQSKGDDAILRVITEELTKEGFTVIPPDSLAGNLGGASGVLTRRAPTADEAADIRFGLKVARTVGALDIGQCVVVRSGVVAAVEALEGTDAALERGGVLGGPGCTAVKALKPGQDERLDKPSIGTATVELLIKHNYACLAFEADKALFFDREAAVALADKAGLCLVGIDAEGNF